MATAMPTVSVDAKTYTFTLRDDLKWSDGSAITVDDFQFAYDQASREDNRYVQLDLLQEIAAYRTPEAHTIEVTLKDPKPRDVALGLVKSSGPSRKTAGPRICGPMRLPIPRSSIPLWFSGPSKCRSSSWPNGLSLCRYQRTLLVKHACRA
jgi:hypothetical protein